MHALLHFIHQYLTEKIIVWPTQDEKEEMKQMYQDLKNFPGVTGMIDGTHIQIKKLADRGFDYYNRKDYYSVIFQAVVREDGRFTHIFTGWPGKVHDAKVFRSSPLYENGRLLCGDDHILGDSAYPNLPFVLTPFRDNGHLMQTQKFYNQVHASIRVTVERAFGLLKGRFVRLQYINQDIKTIVSTIMTCCVLHNICIMNQDEFQDVVQGEAAVPQPVADIQNYDGNELADAAQKRLAIARRL